MNKTIKHYNMLQPNPGRDKEGFEYMQFTCRGCGVGNRKRLLNNFLSSIWHPENRAIDNSYLTLEEEPNNKYDSNAVAVVCKGEFFGTIGYVGREYTTSIKNILNHCSFYRVDIVDENTPVDNDVELLITWEMAK